MSNFSFVSKYKNFQKLPENYLQPFRLIENCLQFLTAKAFRFKIRVSINGSLRSVKFYVLPQLDLMLE